MYDLCYMIVRRSQMKNPTSVRTVGFFIAYTVIYPWLDALWEARVT